jgi:hypothetical protein
MEYDVNQLQADITAQYEQRYKRKPAGTAQIAIEDYARLETLKRSLYADIETRGVMTTESNGRQRYVREHKALTLLPKYIEQQHKLLVRLGLDSKDEAEDSDPDDDFDDF